MSKTQPFKMKLKLNTNAPTAAPPAGSPPLATPGGSSLKLNFKALSATPVEPPSETAAPKEKRKYTKKQKADTNGGSAAAATPSTKAASKKRKNEGDDGGAPAKKQAKQASISNGIQAARPPGMPAAPQRTLSIKINQKPVTKVKAITLKHKGKPPVRPLGVGYDSEAEDVEIDPAIESEFILRMQPGEDCDELRKAIEEKRVGEEFPVSFRFWDKEGRRVTVRIKNRYYAAILVDLPCIVEGMKSWDKRGWYKSADICQMLWVLARVQTDDEAKSYPLPPEIQRIYDQPHGLYQYPHGLTPPMHYVRKRRFRKRVSYRTIEAVEEEVERLMQLDEEVERKGGMIEDQIIEPEALNAESEEDAEGEIDEDADAEGFEEDYDEAMDLEREMMEALGANEEEPAAASAAIHDSLSHDLAPNSAEVHVVLPTTETTPVASPAADAAEESEASSDDDDEDGEEDDIDEDALAAQQEAEQLREEIVDLEKEVELAKAQYDQQTNSLLKQRALNKLNSLRQDLELKKSQLGGEGEE